MDITDKLKIQAQFIDDIKAWRENPERPRLVREFCMKSGMTIKDKLLWESKCNSSGKVF